MAKNKNKGKKCYKPSHGAVSKTLVAKKWQKNATAVQPCHNRVYETFVAKNSGVFLFFSYSVTKKECVRFYSKIVIFFCLFATF